MKRTLLAALIVLFALPLAYGQGERFYQVGDTLTVFALNGLDLREGPDPEARELALLPFGASVRIVAETEPAVGYRADGLAGTWTYVDCAGRRGYVFDGFLSRLPAPGADDDTVYNYVRHHHRFLSESRDEMWSSGSGAISSLTVEYDGDSTVIFATDGAQYWIGSILPVDRLEEGFLLLRAINRSPTLLAGDFPSAVQTQLAIPPAPEDARRGLRDLLLTVERKEDRLTYIQYDFEYAKAVKYYTLSLTSGGYFLRVDEDGLDRGDLPAF